MEALLRVREESKPRTVAFERSVVAEPLGARCDRFGVVQWVSRDADLRTVLSTSTHASVTRHCDRSGDSGWFRSSTFGSGSLSMARFDRGTTELKKGPLDG